MFSNYKEEKERLELVEQKYKVLVNFLVFLQSQNTQKDLALELLTNRLKDGVVKLIRDEIPEATLEVK